MQSICCQMVASAPLILMGVVNTCGCVLWVWPWYMMAIKKVGAYGRQEARYVDMNHCWATQTN